MFNAVFFQSLKDVNVTAKNLSQLQSPGHKREVSGGLVVMSSRSNQISADQSQNLMYDFEMNSMDMNAGALGVICGENIKLVEKEVNYLDAISAKDLFDTDSKTKFKSTSLNRLSRFVEIVNFFGIRFGLFTEDAKIRLNEQNQQLIRDEVLSTFIKAQSLEEGQRVLEPVFIMEIRILLEILRNEFR